MSGVKGRSGRRTCGEDERRRRILQRAWELTDAFFANSDIPAIEKQKVATQLVVKDITQKQSIDGDALTKVIIAYSKPSNDRLMTLSPKSA